jgi:hypothetical protein
VLEMLNHERDVIAINAVLQVQLVGSYRSDLLLVSVRATISISIPDTYRPAIMFHA